MHEVNALNPKYLSKPKQIYIKAWAMSRNNWYLPTDYTSNSWDTVISAFSLYGKQNADGKYRKVNRW